MKKTLTSLLVLALVLSCFAGMTVSAETALVPVTATLQLHSQDLPEEGVAMWDEWAANFGIDLEIQTIASDVVNEKINTLLASGDIADLFWVNASHANLYGPEGTFEPLNAHIANMPNLSAMLAAEDATSRRNADGELYYFPKYAALYATTEGHMTYRKDILEALGETEPTTLEGWYELYKKVQEAYPDMIVLMERHSGIESMMAPVFGMGRVANNAGYVAQDAERDDLVYLPTTENWKAMLEWYNRLYAEGILYEGYATVDYALWWDQTICTDKAFACNTMNFNRGYEATDTAHKNGYDNVEWWVALNPVNPFTETNEILMAGTGWQDFGLALSAESEAKDAIIPFMDFFYSQEMVDTQNTRMDEQELELPLFYWPIQMVNFYVNQEHAIMRDHFSKNSPLVELLPVVGTTAEGAQRITDETEGLADYVEQMRDEFVMGITPLDQWETYVAECEALGSQVIVEVVQTYIDNYNAALAE